MPGGTDKADELAKIAEAWRKVASSARDLLDAHAKMTPEEWERLSPLERKFFADTFTKENLETLRELASGE